MKKLLAMPMILMITISTMSCSNDSMTGSSEPVQKTSITKQALKVAETRDLSDLEQEIITKNNYIKVNDEASKYAIYAVEKAVSNTSSNRLRTYVVCHGSYADSVSWSYVLVVIDGVDYHRLVRRYTMPGGGVLSQTYDCGGPMDCSSTLFW